MAAYYNEIEPYAAAWLRNLIEARLIAPGEVDERSIEDVTPDDIRGFTQCHFFAGIGVWSHALRLAGWPDDRPVWTGSCPCQPFSAAGKRGGTADERHLWPAFFHLIDACRPAVVLGEQVASKDGLAWLDLVSADLEGAGYAFGATDLCAAGVGAPHIRQRLWFVGVADGDDEGLEGRRQPERQRTAQCSLGAGGVAERLADERCPRRERRGSSEAGNGTGEGQALTAIKRPCDVSRLADSNGEVASDRELQRGGKHGFEPQDGGAVRVGDTSIARAGRDTGAAPATQEGRGSEGRTDGQFGSDAPIAAGSICERPGPTNGFWRDSDWLLCRDERWRPVEPGTFPLVNGASARVGRLRAYGNAIVAEAAREFIEAVIWSAAGDLA